MGYMVALLILALLFSALHFFTELGNKEKISIAVVLLLIVFFAIFYNNYNNTVREQMSTTERFFNQGKSVTCNDIEVNQSAFSFSIGTHTFIGKKGSDHAGLMIDIRQCQ